MSHLPIEETEVFKRMKLVANEVWFKARNWNSFAQQTVGRQLVASLDSVCANMAEGDGRYGDPDALRFFAIARGSLREATYWMGAAYDRELLPREDRSRLLAELDEIRQMLNGLIAYRRQTSNKNIVRESEGDYGHVGGEESAPHASRPTPQA